MQVFEMSLCDFGVSSTDMMLISAAQYCPKVSSVTVNWCNISQSAIIKGFHTFSRSLFFQAILLYAACTMSCFSVDFLYRLEEVSLEQQGGCFCNDAIKVLIERHRKT